MTISPSFSGRLGRASAVATAAILGLTIAGGSALAYWSAAGTGTGAAPTGTISTPTMQLTKTSDPSTVTATFAAAATGVAPTSYVATATSSGSPVTCTASASPWTCDLTGLTSGTAYSVTGVAKRSTSWTSTATAPQSLTPAASLSVSTATLPNGTTATAYSQTVAAAGGVTPYTWTVSTGSLPTGLTLSPAGVISGTPTVPATSNFTVHVKDAAGAGQQTATRALSITINPAVVGTPAAFVVTAPTTATAGTAFNVTIQARNSVGNDSTYAGSHTITITGPSASPDGTNPTLPTATAVTFDSTGSATVSVTLKNAESVALAVTDSVTAARNASSGTVKVSPLTRSKLMWTSSNKSCATGAVHLSTNGAAWTSKVTLADAYGNAVPGSAASVTVSKPASTTGTLSGTSLSVASSTTTAETTGQASFTIATGNPTAVTLTAASGGLTSVTCAVDR
jgi:hypothetical protein